MCTRLGLMGLISLALMPLASVGSVPPVSFHITKLYTCKVDGKNVVAYTPKIGENYLLATEFDVNGTPADSFKIHFVMAGKTIDFNGTGGGHQLSVADFGPLSLDDSIPYSVEVGSGTGAGKQNGRFTPAGPSNSVEYYAPVKVTGTQYQTITFKPGGKIDCMELMMGCPESGSWQKVSNPSCTVESGLGTVQVKSRHVDNPSDMPVYFWEGKNVPVKKITMTQKFTLELSSARTNPAVMKSVTWGEIDALMGINVFKFYTQPESVVESKDPKITDFVKDTLGADYRKHFSPYEASRKMFQAVVKKVKYTYPSDGKPDLRPKTAAGVLEHGLGDCGGFSILLVACYRNMGIPARTACGGWVGKDEGHCWCEEYFPRHGWMVSDGSGGNGQDENGQFAYCFGSMVDLDGRFACMRGNTFNVKDVTTSWLQGPIWPVIHGTAQIASVESHTVLEDAPEFMSTRIAKRSDYRALCKCHHHGGFAGHTDATPMSTLR